MKKLLLPLLSLGVAVTMMGCNSESGEAGHEHDDGHEHADEAEEHSHDEGDGHSAESAEVPDNIADLRVAISDQNAALGKIIDAKELDKVHVAAFRIRDYVNALAAKSEDAVGDKFGKLQGQAKNVVDLAERLDTTGDGGDQAGTEANYKKLQGVLLAIESYYPGGTAAYVCPMHKEITSAKPGECSKCGMMLKPIAKTP